MALVLKDRVLESSTSTGTGTFTLTGAQTGYQSFTVIGNGNTTYYTIQGKNPDGTLTGEWEVGEGTWSTGNTLARNTVLESSNSNNLVSFSAGDKDVFCTYAADKTVIQDASNKVSGYAIENSTIGATTPSTGSFTTLIGGAGSDNYITLSGAATTKAVEFDALGSDTNISMAFQPKGTGAIDLSAGSSGVNISNGGTVTAITQTAGGTYTSVPTVAITAPTTAGGVQATATVSVQATSGTTITSGGTGYTVGNVLTVVGGTFSTAAQFTVSTVSAGVITGITVTTSGSYSVTPTNPVSVTGGSGSGATFTMQYTMRSGTFVITNAGSGYIEQPTVTFSGGGGSGASAFATVGSGTTITTLASPLTLQTPALNANNTTFQVRDDATIGASQTTFYMIGASSGLGRGALRANKAFYIASGSSNNINFLTNSGVVSEGSTQMVVANTVSAVNYVQVTGGVSGDPATVSISAQGSSSNTNLALTPRGTGAVVLNNAVTMSATTEAINIGTSQTTGNLTIGGSSATGTINITQATGNHTVNIANGTLVALRTRTINIGVAAAGSSLTITTIGTTGVAGGNRSYTLFNGTIRLQTFTVAGLPTGIVGARSFVTDALAPSFGLAVVGNGTVPVPVYHDGTSWRVG